jgi:hypothetical protein
MAADSYFNVVSTADSYFNVISTADNVISTADYYYEPEK